MNTAIIYYSNHHGNTKKLLDAIADYDSDVMLIDVTKDTDINLSSFDRIGFASGIYFSAVSKQIVSFAKNCLPKSIREVAKMRGCHDLGTYHCLGYDTYGLFKVIGGIAKGHPNKKDIDGAVNFYKEL